MLILKTSMIAADADVNQAVPGDGNPLIAAAKTGDLQIAQRLLSLGADIDGFVFADETPLSQAILARQYEMVAFLIERGADVNKAVPFNRQLRSPMSVAQKWGEPAIIELLRHHGPEAQK